MMSSTRAMLALFAIAGGTLVAVTVAVAPAAGAATLRHDGLRANAPSSATVYNGAKVTLRPRVSAASGSRRQIRAKGLYAYRGSRQVAHGSSIRLPAGSYKVATSVRYRSFRDVKVKHVRRTFHDGTKARGSYCRVTEIVPDEFDSGYGEIARARCRNSEFPDQLVYIDGPVADYQCFDACSVDETFDSDVPDFRSFTSSKVTYSKVRKYSAVHRYTFPKRAFTVRDGGHRRVLSGSESLTTSYFHVPTASRWRADYAYDCSSFGYSGNWIVDLHRQGTSVLDDQNLDNVIRYSDYGSYRFSRGGTYRFQVITECDWRIVVHWK